MDPRDVEPLDAAEAVARLLQAEAEAREALARSEADATREVARARDDARALLAAADRRIEAAAQRARARLEHAIAELRAARHALEAPAMQDDARRARLAAAVERLAAQLTTPDDGGR